MRKVLVAVFCLFLFGACSQKSEMEQTEIPERGLELAVRSGEGVIPEEGMSASVYDLTYLKSDEVCEPVYFAAGEPIAFKDLDAGEHTFFVLGNDREEQSNYVVLRDKDKKVFFLQSDYYTLPELFGGVARVDGANASETVVMNRLVGGLVVNVVNEDEFYAMDIFFDRPELDEIQVNDYTIIPQWDSYNLGRGYECYSFPTKNVVSGTVIVWDEYKNESYFDFKSEKCIERNKKLELNITLVPGSSIARSGDAGNKAVCEEKVSDL